AGLNTRRHEAELKLRAAETNLERLTEVSAEVERQLESLKRQARKARKYKALSDEILALEALAAHLKWDAATTGLEEANTALDTAKSDVERLTREAAMAEKRRIEAGDGIGALREAEALAGAKLGQARIALARLEAEHKSAVEAKARLEGEARRLIEDMEREQASITEAEAALAVTRDELNALPVLDESQNAEKEAAAREAVEAARLRLRQCEAEADQVQAELSEARARQHAARSALHTAQTRVDGLGAQVRKLEAEREGLADRAALAARVQAAEAEVERAELALADAQRAQDGAEEALAEAREAESAAEPARADADQAVRTLEAEISGLQRLLRRQEGPSAPPVIEAIRTQDGYETAVAAALGDDLQAPTDRSAALFWGGANVSGPALPAGATPLSNFVEAPGQLAARLSQCGVVSTEDGEHLASGLVPGQRLVSTEGHLWRWDGFTRTPRAPVSAAERLAQQARLEAAEAELPPLKEALSQAETLRKSLREDRLEAETAFTEVKKAVSPASQALEGARRTLAEARQALERASVKHDSLEEALGRARSELALAEEALRAADPNTGTEDLSALETRLSTCREAVHGAREAETEARGRLTDLTRNREQAEKRRAGLERDLESWVKRKASAEQRLAALVTRRREAADAANQMQVDPEAMAMELATLSQRVEGFETDRKSAADRLAERETALREAETTLRTAESAAAKARETLAGCRVKLENAEARLEDLVEQARESFQRQPAGLLMLAKAGLDEETLAELDLREAETRAMLARRDRDSLGGVNMEAEAEAEELAERMGSQEVEKADLTGAIAKLREGVDALNAEGRDRLLEAFETVNEHFKALFTALFRGGQAELRLVDADDPLASGLEIMAQPPGKRLGTLNLMSGGEQALTAAALIFAVFLSRPAPICVLDEVDAPLDDANVDRFCRMLDEMRQRTDTRFIIITHNPVTMSRMDRLFGVTMREKGVSKLVSVDLGTAEELVAAE
ncbi:MAG: chromosome segregation protein SMC, partial [Hyphomonadaceae bacterium]|nr:chromosome segregation protein SMC [Hyphomonadaceae bacterium]